MTRDPEVSLMEGAPLIVPNHNWRESKYNIIH